MFVKLTSNAYLKTQEVKPSKKACLLPFGVK